MAKEKVAMGGALLLFAAALANGQTVRTGGGCAVLEKLVEDRVHAAATGYRLTGSAGGPVHGDRAADRTGLVGSVAAEGEVCGATVQVTTRAFSRALAGLNIPVTWNHPPHPGEFCWSGDLSQCQPSGDPGVPALPPNRMAFVYDAWKGVRRAVASQMPLGTAGGVSRFTAGSLDSALSSNLNGLTEPL